MCVTFGKANISNTIISNSVLPNGNHLMCYQNNIENLEKGLNVLILPIPSIDPIGEFNIINSEKMPHILHDMKDAIYEDITKGVTRGMPMSFSDDSIEVFRSGIYTMATYCNPNDIQNVLDKLPEDKRFAPNKKIMEDYQRFYYKWWKLLCIFDVKEMTESHPIMIAYNSMFKDMFFYPTLDAHSGKTPDLNANVYLDHTLIAGSDNGFKVNYSDLLDEETRKLLPSKIIGKRNLDYKIKNGDFYVSIEKANKNKFSLERRNPPGVC